MSLLRSVIGAGLANEAVLPLLRRLVVRGRPMVLMYHELAPDRADIDAWTVVRERDFIQQIDYLRRRYRIVPLEELICGREGGQGRPRVAITFDDGDAGNFEVLLPLVERLALPVAIFIATGQIEAARPYWFDRVVNSLQLARALELDLRSQGLGVYRVSLARGAGNWLEIQRLLKDIKQQPPDRSDGLAERVEELTAGHRDPACARIMPLTVEQVRALGRCPFVTIGAHSHCHRLLTRLPMEQARASIEQSRSHLRSWTGQPVDYFAYPSGAWDELLAGLVEDLGFRAAFTTQERLWDPQESRFCIPRMGVGRYDSPQQFRLNLVGGVRSLVQSLRRGAAAAGGRP